MTKGILLLPVLPALAAFLLMVTALTYQFQGWLASLMSNPRRRRTVIVVIDDDLRADRSVAEPDELRRALGGTTAGGSVERRWRKSWRSWIARLKRGKSTRRSSCVDSRKSSKKHKLATQQADRDERGTLAADGPAREHGLARRMAAAGRHGRGRGPTSCRRFWGCWE